MGPIEAGLWGLAGGTAAGLVALSASVVAASYTFPRTGREEGLARLFVMAVGLALGALVAAAASQQMSGPWPAFILGVGAPSMVQGLLARVEVTGAKPGDAAQNELEGGEKDAARAG
ncbi:hypothetical protein Psi02_00020 [Planotetraspora silvatica]|uniref:Uncharacterized protein n=1 Tax=Planotetraspora silvatica TaxID=234614 RepID=A0A8J3XP64_9ACTN|nr:hypothetical protein Psi02_00020 [Planotetraspora silvatica]